jgi:SRSO17 transposase
VTLSVANEAASLPVAYRLYLPEAWAADPARRITAGVPEEVALCAVSAQEKERSNELLRLVGKRPDAHPAYLG